MKKTKKAIRGIKTLAAVSLIMAGIFIILDQERVVVFLLLISNILLSLILQ